MQCFIFTFVYSISYFNVAVTQTHLYCTWKCVYLSYMVCILLFVICILKYLTTSYYSPFYKVQHKFEVSTECLYEVSA